MTGAMLQQLGAIAGATLISEDLTGLSAALLAAAGAVPLWSAIGAVGVGIWFGDMGLWAAGRLSGSLLDTVRTRSWLDRLDVPAVAGRLRRHAGVAVFASRFLPGTRLPLYVAAGASGVGALRFGVWTALAVALWTPLIMVPAALLGEAIADPLRNYFRAAWIVVPAVVLIAGFVWARSVPRRIARIARWEFWPSWLFYAPVVPWVGCLMLKYGARAITAANPGIEDGGFVGESKSRILDKLPKDWTLAHALIAPGPLGRRMQTFRAHVASSGSQYPVILKPDVGQRGAGVRLVRSDADAVSYLIAEPRPIVAQVYHPGPYEAGIFYYRMPGEESGHIFSITDKQFPFVVGDGATTLGNLIEQHPRHRLQAELFQRRHQQHLSRVPAAGEAVRLAIAGNHAQGTLFLDGSDLLTSALAARIDEISKSIEGFYIGRFDVRYRDPDGLMAGTDLAIVELNGVTSEATHIYDPSRSLWAAYCTLFRQWKLVFVIGAANLRAGHSAVGLVRLVRLSAAHLATPARQLIAD